MTWKEAAALVTGLLLLIALCWRAGGPFGPAVMAWLALVEVWRWAWTLQGCATLFTLALVLTGGCLAATDTRRREELRWKQREEQQEEIRYRQMRRQEQEDDFPN